jgi:hypothetical protein
MQGAKWGDSAPFHMTLFRVEPLISMSPRLDRVKGIPSRFSATQVS